jgi:hypothetical protein
VLTPCSSCALLRAAALLFIRRRALVFGCGVTVIAIRFGGSAAGSSWLGITRSGLIITVRFDVKGISGSGVAVTKCAYSNGIIRRSVQRVIPDKTGSDLVLARPLNW